jgi:hypothetical protein
LPGKKGESFTLWRWGIPGAELPERQDLDGCTVILRGNGQFFRLVDLVEIDSDRPVVPLG